MKAVAESDSRGTVIASAIIVGALALLAGSVVTDSRALQVASLVAVVSTVIASHRWWSRWENMVSATILVILFIPIKRYSFPVNLPFDLEPYRVVVALLVALWVSSLLIDRRVRLRASGFEKPLLLIAFAILASVVFNPTRVNATASEVAKALTFFASFFFMLYVIASTLRAKHIDFIVKTLVLGGSTVAFFALIERRLGYNVFNHLSSVIPFLQFEGVGSLERGGRLRVLASAQHPIAAGALMVFLIPLAVYLVRRTQQRRWWLAAGLLLLAGLATGSRTAVMMLIVEAGVFAILRPVETRRFWPALIPAVLVIHAVVPGAIGTVRASFFPKGGLVAEQSYALGSERRCPDQ